MANNSAPNFLRVIDAFEAGRDRAERSRLRDLAEQGRLLQGQALQGDQNALARLGSVDSQAYMNVKNFTRQEKQQFIQDFTRQAYAADTPEKWNAMIQGYKAQGRTFADGEDSWQNRDALIARGLDVGDMMGLDLRREEAKRTQANADRTFQAGRADAARSQANTDRAFAADEKYRATQADLERQKAAGKAPDVVEIYDEQGRPQKAIYNSQTGQFDPIGGAKVKERTVDENKADAILQGAQGSFAPALENYGDLSDWQNTGAQSIDVLPFGITKALPRAFMSEKGQTGQDAVRNIVSNYIYALSGAQAPETEVSRNMDLVTPRVTDSQATINAKRARLVDMVNTLRTRAGQPALSEDEIIGGASVSGAAPGRQSSATPPANANTLIQQANEAIQMGADPAKVQQRLREQGVEADFTE